MFSCRKKSPRCCSHCRGSIACGRCRTSVETRPCAQTWPVIRALRRERFDRSVDFASNDRGAIVSFLIGARQRLGWTEPGGFLGRQFCYNQRVAPENEVRHESARLAHLLSAWDIAPSSLTAEIRADPVLTAPAQKILPPGKIICHIASSQSKKEWPLSHWAALHRMAVAAGVELIFSTGIGAREESLLKEFKRLAPGAPVLEPVPDLALYLAVLRQARGFVSGDTGPLHFAAGLGVPTLALFGPSSPAAMGTDRCAASLSNRQLLHLRQCRRL